MARGDRISRIYSGSWMGYAMTDLDRLVKAFYDGAMFQIGLIKAGAWKHFTSNFLREYARAKYGLKFSNTVSPDVLRELVKRYPEMRHWVELGRTWT